MKLELCISEKKHLTKVLSHCYLWCIILGSSLWVFNFCVSSFICTITYFVFIDWILVTFNTWNLLILTGTSSDGVFLFFQQTFGSWTLSLLLYLQVRNPTKLDFVVFGKLPTFNVFEDFFTSSRLLWNSQCFVYKNKVHW